MESSRLVLCHSKQHHSIDKLCSSALSNTLTSRVLRVSSCNSASCVLNHSKRLLSAVRESEHLGSNSLS